MDAKRNCWDFKQCGREVGGSRTEELGVCPAATDRRAQGINGGLNGGRACWALTGTFCGGVAQGTFAAKLGNCMSCDFLKLVAVEEGKHIVHAREILERVKHKAV